MKSVFYGASVCASRLVPALRHLNPSSDTAPLRCFVTAISATHDRNPCVSTPSPCQRSSSPLCRIFALGLEAVAARPPLKPQVNFAFGVKVSRFKSTSCLTSTRSFAPPPRPVDDSGTEGRPPYDHRLKREPRRVIPPARCNMRDIDAIERMFKIGWPHADGVGGERYSGVIT